MSDTGSGAYILGSQCHEKAVIEKMECVDGSTMETQIVDLKDRQDAVRLGEAVDSSTVPTQAEMPVDTSEHNSAAEGALEQAMLSLKQQSDIEPINAPPAASEEPAANAVPAKVRVLWHTEIGVIISHYSRVHVQRDLIVLVVNDSEADGTAYIPRPATADGALIAMKLECVGPNGTASVFDVRPTGLQFTMDAYSFIILLREEAE